MGATGMTLVFNRAALQRLAEPGAALDDAREWTTYLGVFADEAQESLSAYADRHGIDPDFLSSGAGQTGGLAAVRQRYPTDRHVFVGTTDADRQLAQSLGWEYLSVDDAAAAADWSLGADDG